MPNQPAIDITEIAVLGEQFPLRLAQLGFHLMQMMDVTGRDLFRYVLPPVVAVPAGPFLMGSDRQRDPETNDDELPHHTVWLQTYNIGMYPLTVAEYAYFLHETHCSAPESWSDQQQSLDHPVVDVAWNDVLAYAHWLAQVTGDPWRLPTEAEWEKAARGTDGQIYPWGDQWEAWRANVADWGPRDTTPVGSYPTGASPYGAHDMAGNVWEWTCTKYRDYPYNTMDGRENVDPTDEDDLVLRGGAGPYEIQHARAAIRLSFEPSYSDYTIGVRLVCGDVAG